MSTPKEAWRQRRTARLYDTGPRVMGLVVGPDAEMQERIREDVVSCGRCGYSRCSCEALRMIEPSFAGVEFPIIQADVDRHVARLVFGGSERGAPGGSLEIVIRWER